VSDPDGDTVSLVIAEPFEGLRLERLGGTADRAFFQVRLRFLKRSPVLSTEWIAPERIALVARDSGSPPAPVPFVQDLRFSEFQNTNNSFLQTPTSLDSPQLALGDVTGDGTRDVVHRLLESNAPRILVHPGEDLGAQPTVLPLPPLSIPTSSG